MNKIKYGLADRTMENILRQRRKLTEATGVGVY